MIKAHKPLALCILASALLISGCRSVAVKEGEREEPSVSEKETLRNRTEGEGEAKRGSEEEDREGGGEEDRGELSLLFAGDIMAHDVNYRMKDYTAIWSGVKELPSSCDIAFANIEMPVDDDLPMSNYPLFNVHSNYVEAAIEGGFNVFSLVNNHTNDQGLDGIKATKKWADARSNEGGGGERGERGVWFSGLKERSTDDMSYAIISVKGFRVLFLAITEILNRGNYSSYMNFVNIDKESRGAFIEKIKALRKEVNCDIFVVSVHANVSEYVHTIAASRRAWYKELLEAGVDAVWANHPHIVQDVELYGEKIIMYACGNTISGQRPHPQFENPRNEKDWRGDGLMVKAVYGRDGGIILKKAEKYFITTYIYEGNYVVKMLDSGFILQLKNEGKTDWAAYLEERRKIMNEVRIDTRG